MAESRSDQEPSIEEILASIREIISDDDAPKEADESVTEIAEEEPAPVPQPVAAAAPAPAPAPKPAAASAPVSAPSPVQAPAAAGDNDDILDLGAFAKTSTAPVAPAPQEKRDPLAGINLEKSREMTVAFTEPEPEPEHVSAPKQPMAVSMPSSSPESILTDSAKNASIDSLTRLAQNIAISRSGNGATLEDLVREMLKPMVRDWLDRNLPPMIERMVERELERLVKQAMDR